MTKKKIVQSQLNRYFIAPPQTYESVSESEPPDTCNITPTQPQVKPRRNKRRYVSDFDDYRITRQTNMVTYRQALHNYRNRVQKSDTDPNSKLRFKRQHSALPSSPPSPPTATSQKNKNNNSDSPHIALQKQFILY